MGGVGVEGVEGGASDAVAAADVSDATRVRPTHATTPTAAPRTRYDLR